MLRCPSCSTPAPETARFCPSCGGPVSAPSQIPTQFSPAPRSATPSPTPAPYAPGEVVAERYRVVGLLGRGGMGEVYRADDLKLGQQVALKFLPRALEDDPRARERFHAEVRLARQVSHPHVCRVHDIGELAGRPFLSMEYVDGEDLATLLRRIGRLPPAKAVEIARQLCAGLAAAHDKGVLHRDLKPANVMVDGHGRARITDFGLAVDWQEALGEIAGTPAYMAPERLAGGPATVRSDLYELGLVLYELFTGRHAFDAQRPASRPLTHPSTFTSDMDPAAERTILRCLEEDPERRPRSVAEVALALPGADPLAAAVAAGETPSPEMVAAAGGEGGLSRGRAWTLLGACGVLLVAIVALAPASTDLGIAPMDRGPEVLRHRAEEIATRFAGGAPAADSAWWMERNYDLIRWMADHLPSTEWRRRLSQVGSPVLLHLRTSPGPLLAANSAATVTEEDPAPTVPGMVHVVVDARGRLCLFERVLGPWPAGGDGGDGEEVSWEALFAETGMDPARFTEVDPTRLPPVPFDARREWTGTHAAVPELPIRLSAAALSNRLVHVALLGPWDAPTAVDPIERAVGLRVGRVTLAVILVIVVVAVPLFVRRNLRLGRGDRRGAARLAVVVGVLTLLAWLGPAHLPADPAAAPLLLGALAAVALQGMFVWLGYLAFEPYLRRRTPELLIGWTRLLEGRLADPRVGRDLLWGALLGAAAAVVLHVVNGLPTWIPVPGQTTVPVMTAAGRAQMMTLGGLFALPFIGLVRAFTLSIFALLLRLLVKRDALVLAGMWLAMTLLTLGGENARVEAPGSIAVALLLTIAVTRLGLLATAAMIAVQLLLMSYPPLLGGAGWYAPYALAALGGLLALLVWSFRVSLAGMPAFGGSLED